MGNLTEYDVRYRPILSPITLRLFQLTVLCSLNIYFPASAGALGLSLWKCFFSPWQVWRHRQREGKVRDEQKVRPFPSPAPTSGFQPPSTGHSRGAVGGKEFWSKWQPAVLTGALDWTFVSTRASTLLKSGLFFQSITKKLFNLPQNHQGSRKAVWLEHSWEAEQSHFLFARLACSTLITLVGTHPSVSEDKSATGDAQSPPAWSQSHRVNPQGRVEGDGRWRSEGERRPAASGRGPTGGARKRTAGRLPTAHGWRSKQNSLVAGSSLQRAPAGRSDSRCFPLATLPHWPLLQSWRSQNRKEKKLPLPLHRANSEA